MTYSELLECLKTIHPDNLHQKVRILQGEHVTEGGKICQDENFGILIIASTKVIS